jgi:hypothetical protein
MRLATLFTLVLFLGCSTTMLAPDSGFEEVLGAYHLSSGKKALALAVDPKGRKAYAVRSGDWRQKSCNRKALAACNSKAARHGIAAQCYLFAVGDEAAPSTLRGCTMGRISEKRCALQRRYPLGGN